MVRYESGAAIELEVWEVPASTFGSFVAGIPAPLGIGSVELESGDKVQGFVCETYAVTQAEDITALGGWRKFSLRILNIGAGAHEFAPDMWREIRAIIC